MADNEVRDVMNRRTVPKVSVEVKFQTEGIGGPMLMVKFKNESNIMFHFAADIRFPTGFHGLAVDFAGQGWKITMSKEGVHYWALHVVGGTGTVRSPLFPLMKQFIQVPFNYAKMGGAFNKLPSNEDIEIIVYAENMAPVRRTV